MESPTGPELNSTTEINKIPTLLKRESKILKIIILILTLLLTISGTIVFLLSKNFYFPTNQKSNSILPTTIPTLVTPTAITPSTSATIDNNKWKTYTNTQYNFQLIYPKFGTIQDPSCFQPGGKCDQNLTGECGNGIREINDSQHFIAIDNFFGIFPETWIGTISDYVKQNDPKGVINYSLISVVGADEAIKIDDYNRSKLSNDELPPLTYIIYIIKKGNMLFKIKGFQDLGAINGCVTWDKSLNWNIAQSFKFIN
jgi:hypothetical protein